jgi:ribosomal protein S27AE
MQYDKQWQDLRRRRRLFWTIFFCWAPVCVVIGVSLDAISPGLGNRLILWIALPWMAVYVALGVAVMFFRCPRCGELYFHGRVWNLWRRECGSCGVPIWSPNDKESGLNFGHAASLRAPEYSLR